MHRLSVLCLASTLKVNKNGKSVASNLMNHGSQGSFVHVRIRQKKTGVIPNSVYYGALLKNITVFLHVMVLSWRTPCQGFTFTIPGSLLRV